MEKNKYFYLKISITILLIGLLLYNTDMKLLIQSLKEISIFALIVCTVLAQIGIWSNSIKWWILLPKYKIRKLYALNLIAQYYSMVLPGQLIGEGIKAYILGKEEGNIEEVAVTVIIDKITSIIGLLIVSTVGLTYSTNIIDPIWMYLLIAMIIIIFIGIFLIKNKKIYNFIVNAINYIQYKLPKMKKILNKVINLLKAWNECSSSMYKIVINIILGGVYQLIVVSILYIFSIEINAQVGYINFCWILSMVSLVLFLPITIAGIGVREGTMVALLNIIGVSNEKALALSLLLLFIQISNAFFGAISNLLWKSNARIKY